MESVERKAFVLLSGGIDSTTCLYQARKNLGGGDSGEIEAISIDYGQKHLKEISIAKECCEELGISHKVLPLGDLLKGRGIMLTDADVEIPSVSYDQIVGVSPTYVPFRNGTMLSVIAALAQKYVKETIQFQIELDPRMNEIAVLEQARNSVGIYFGAHAEDAQNWAYPDCTPEFIGSMANAIYTGTYYTTRLHAPLMNLDKSQVITLGASLGVPFEKTWSCYVGGKMHCGKCPTCQSRRDGFIKAGVNDPTEYATENVNV